MNFSIWEKESFYAPTDVLIVGAGLLGLWTARELKIKRPTLKVKLIDAGNLPCGASTRNAGFACYGSPSELLHDATMDENAMWQTVELRYRGIQKIREVFDASTIGFEPCGGYECYKNTLDTPMVSLLELQWLNAGIEKITHRKNTFAVATEKLKQLGLQGFDALIENADEGSLHSGKLVQHLTQEVRGLGVEIIGGLEVIAYEKNSGGWLVFCKNGAELQAQQLAITTNGFISKLLPRLSVKPARGQVLLSPPIPNLKLRGTFHFDAGFYYWRHLGNRILLGGARNADFKTEETTQLDTTPNLQQKLFDFMQLHFADMKHIAQKDCQQWAGIMAMSDTKQPILQHIEPNLWVAMCCNGMGVALSPVWAEKLADAILN